MLFAYEDRTLRLHIDVAITLLLKLKIRSKVKMIGAKESLVNVLTNPFVRASSKIVLYCLIYKVS